MMYEQKNNYKATKHCHNDLRKFVRLRDSLYITCMHFDSRCLDKYAGKCSSMYRLRSSSYSLYNHLLWTIFKNFIRALNRLYFNRSEPFRFIIIIIIVTFRQDLKTD